ncbi:MAG: HAMP domain-containing sensor histidine kinase [Planctomycetota bacterium]
MLGSDQRSPWWCRISVRVALLSAIGMVAFYLLGRELEDLVADALALPDAVLLTDWIDEDLLRDAEQQGEGHWVPSEEAVARLADDEADKGCRFAWLTADLVLVAASPDAPWPLGEPWQGGAELAQTVAWPEVGEAPAICVPVEHDGEMAGFMVTALVDRAHHAERHGVAVAELEDLETCWFSDPASSLPLPEMQAQSLRVSTAVSLLLAVVMALAVATATSQWVTRRLSRLARAAAAAPAGGDAALLEVRGRDEVATLAAALNEMRGRTAELLGDLAQRDVARREWVAQVAHDLRTPLTALGVCLDRAEWASPDALREILRVARLDAARVASIAEDLLELHRLEGEPHLDLEPVLPGELVDSAVVGLRPLAERSGIELGTKVERGLPVMRGDGKRLLRALENLIENAVRHAAARVVVAAKRTAEGVRFEVRDDGSGFHGLSSGAVDLAAAHTSASRRGSGLGLTVVDRIACAHGGELAARNEPSSGAAVSFWLPLPGPEQA